MAPIVAEVNSIPEAFYRISSEKPETVVYTQAQASASTSGSTIPTEPRKWLSTTFAESKSRVSKIARHLRSMGVVKGSKVAILAQSRPEWMEADIAILSEGGIAVSIYQSLPAEDVAYILYDSASEIVVAENQEQVDKLIEITSREFDIASTKEREATKARISIKGIIAMESVTPHALVTQLSEILSQEESDAPQGISSLGRDDLAALVYTSGTTGPPKGVMQTHGNHLSNVRQALDSTMLREDSVLCLFLPLAHSFAKLIGYMGFLTSARLCFPAITDTKTSKMVPQSVTKDISESGAGIFPVVPRLLEKMRDGVLAAKSSPGLKGKLITLTLWSADQTTQAAKHGRSTPLLATLGYALTGGLRNKIKVMLFGPNHIFCLSGGAKLPESVAEFFNGLGIPVLEGYGLTETAVACTVGRLGQTPVGSVGPVLSDDIEVKIEEDGEICFRGPNVALGYYNRKSDTDASWDSEGWFHTGDLGSIDEKGELRIVGRKKEIIVTSGGKNIAPNDIEEQIKASPLVSQVVLVGDGRKYCVALVSLNVEEARRWANNEHLPEDTVLHENSQIKEKIWSHVQNCNKELASFETVKKIYIVPEDFSVENGFLTPTFKVKRSLVEKHYTKEIDALY